jgi:hypothetical protein
MNTPRYATSRNEIIPPEVRKLLDEHLPRCRRKPGDVIFIVPGRIVTQASRSEAKSTVLHISPDVSADGLLALVDEAIERAGCAAVVFEDGGTRRVVSVLPNPVYMS